MLPTLYHKMKCVFYGIEGC